jgi:RNA polymerase sigma-70 factor, ECF subfamily
VPTDEEAVRLFLTHDYPRIVAAVALICENRPAAEDAVQEALARAWERGERGEHFQSLAAWVTTVAMNLSRSRLRRLRVERTRAPALAERTGVPPADADDRMDVRRALATLPRRQREVTVLRYYLDMDVAQIAGALNISEGTVKTWLFRARRTLADHLGTLEEANDV